MDLWQQSNVSFFNMLSRFVIAFLPRSKPLFFGEGGAALPKALAPWTEGRGCRYLIDVVQLEVFQQQQQDGRNGLNDDLFVAVHIHSQLHALQHCGAGSTTPGGELLKPSLLRPRCRPVRSILGVGLRQLLFFFKFPGVAKIEN